MTTEEKDLLRKDLCARLPYGVIVSVTDGTIKYEAYIESVSYKYIQVSPVSGSVFTPYTFYKISEIKPYLRPMSSMTEEEMDKLADFHIWNDGEKIFPDCNCKLSDIVSAMNWLNKKMFDYRGLIEKGLALEAPEGMYNIKNK